MISDNVFLFRKLEFALILVNIDCEMIKSVEIGAAQKIDPHADAYFMDAYMGIAALEQYASWLKSASNGRASVPVILITYIKGMKIMERADVFDETLQFPFYRKDLYRLLKKYRVIKADTRISPMFDLLPHEKIKTYFSNLKTTGVTLFPVYFRGYHYPKVDEFFPCDQRDSIAILLHMYSQGFLERTLFDRVHQCPKCDSSQINFFECCPQCHSIDYSTNEMLHHFSCGYVGDSKEFETNKMEDLTCPKCHKILRHIGLDYEKPISSFSCNACHMKFKIAAVRCRCFVCNYVFPSEDAIIQNVYSYKAKEQLSPAAMEGIENKEFSLSLVSRELFLFLLTKNIIIARELNLPINLIGIDVSSLQKSESQTLVNKINEFKRMSNVVYHSPMKVILILVFYLSSEEAEQDMTEFQEICKTTPILSQKEIPFKLFCYSGSDSKSAATIVDDICKKMRGRNE